MRKSKTTKKFISLDSQFSISQDKDSYQIIEKKRNNRKKNTKEKKRTTSNNLQSDAEVIDIKRGDKFIRQHYTPDFLKKWDKQSNQFDISEQDLKDLSPMMRVYWQIKCKNMNSVIFVQVGSTDFLCFETDALLINELLGRSLRKFSIFLMVSFWRTEMQMVKLDLHSRNIPMLIMTQIDDLRYKQENGITLRQITQRITPSLYLSIEPKSYNRRLLLAVIKGDNAFGITALQSQSNRFYTEVIQGQNNFHEIRRIINRYRPVELVISKKGQFNKQFKFIAKSICNPYTIQVDFAKRNFEDMNTEFLVVSNNNPFFRQLRLLFQEQGHKRYQKFSKFELMCSLDLVLAYLKKLNMSNKVFGQGIFSILPFSHAKQKPIFDSQVYENLQIFKLKNEEDSPQGAKGTLLGYMDYCVTHAGKKVLRRWIDQPLRIENQIYQRQELINELCQKEIQKSFVHQLHKKFISFEKLEKQITDIYHCVQEENQKGKLKLTDKLKFNKDYNANKNPAVKLLKDIWTIFQKLQESQKLFNQIYYKQFSSKLFKKISKVVKIDQQDLIMEPIQSIYQIQGIPSIEGLINYLRSKVYYDQQSGILQPAQGTSQIYDEQKKAISQIQQKLDNQLKKWKQKIKGGKISYASVRARNQIQISQAAMKNTKFSQLIYSSETKQYIRYTTSQTQELTDQLKQHQDQISKAYQPFLNEMVLNFCRYKYIWDKYVNNIAQMDVLLSITKMSLKMSPRCLPRFTYKGINIIQGSHPGLLQVCQNVVPTTLQLKDDQNVLLLTGPNMGGKSTLLRQTCLLAILAQIGSFVPAKKYQTIIFDQIFCRIGASDRIIQGKSTFYVQLEQTQRILSQATQNSLVIIDQLGRGTSTYDGMAIADSVLRFLMQQTCSYTLFSTHYKPLTDWFQKEEKVRCMKMGYKIKEQNIQSISFTYKLEDGVAQKSFANNVARMVGIPQEIMKIANNKAGQIVQQQRLVRQGSFKGLIKDMQLLKLDEQQ